jgi:hypothetical protein
MEVGVVLGFALWGHHLGTTELVKIVLTVLLPTVAFAFWGLVDFRWLGRSAEALRQAQELVISGAAAIGFVLAGSAVLGWGLVVLSIAHHVLLHLSGDRLLGKGA